VVQILLQHLATGSILLSRQHGSVLNLCIGYTGTEAGVIVVDHSRVISPRRSSCSF